MPLENNNGGVQLLTLLLFKMLEQMRHEEMFYEFCMMMKVQETNRSSCKRALKP